MIWEPDTPEDSTYPANQIHVQFHGDKEMLRERFEAPDGAINAHTDADSDNAGIHQASLVGFCRVHQTVAAFNAFTPKKAGTLHAIVDPRRLYTISAAGAAVLIYPVAHANLANLDADDHPQYQTNTFSRAFTGNVTIHGTFEIQDSGIGDVTPLDPSHINDEWVTAHGVGQIGRHHFQLDSIAVPYLIEAVGESVLGWYEPTPIGRYSIPWLHIDSAPGGARFYQLRHDVSLNRLGFHHSTHGWVAGTIRYGDFGA